MCCTRRHVSDPLPNNAHFCGTATKVVACNHTGKLYLPFIQNSQLPIQLVFSKQKQFEESQHRYLAMNELYQPRELSIQSVIGLSTSPRYPILLHFKEFPGLLLTCKGTLVLL